MIISVEAQNAVNQVNRYTSAYDQGFPAWELVEIRKSAMSAIEDFTKAWTTPTFGQLRDFLGSAREAEEEYRRAHVQACDNDNARQLYRALRNEMHIRPLMGKLYPHE